MNKEVEKAINQIKTFLGMEVKLAQMKLADGTLIEAESFEAEQSVSIVNEEGNVPMPIGEYELEDGMMLVVAEEGVIAEVKEKVEEETTVAEVEEEAPQMEADKPAVAKKVVESTVKETHFSKVEELEAKIVELEAKIVELSKVEEVKVELSEDVKPIVHNPENKKQIEIVKLGKSKSPLDKILESVYK